MRWFFVLATFCLFLPFAQAATYYVDSASGDDTHSGVSPAMAWATLKKVDSITFAPGDSLLFKRGGQWSGSLTPHGSGLKGKPITIDAYGKGNLPILKGGEASDSVLTLYNQSYWIIRNLEITNDATSPSVRSGVLIQAINEVSNDIILKGLFVHHVNGISAWGNDKWANAGIRFNVWQDPAKRPAAAFVGTQVDSCTIQEIHAIAILMLSNSSMKNSGVLVSNNRIDRTGADGIVVQGANAPHITGNRCFRIGKIANDFQYIAGIWAMQCESPLIERNEVAYTALQVTDGKIFYGDSQAFDIDNGCTGTPCIQYNYSHNNAGGFLEVMPNSPVEAILVRYNISVNDDHINCGNNTTLHLLRGKIYLYNNVFYDGKGKGIVIYDREDTYYQNNIFRSTGVCQYGSKPQYRNNCFSGHVPVVTDSGKILDDPGFVHPGNDTEGFATCEGYQIGKASPCRGKGIAVISHGVKDFFGNPLLSSSTDIGAHQISRQ